jgi:hypothetical protein
MFPGRAEFPPKPTWLGKNAQVRNLTAQLLIGNFMNKRTLNSSSFSSPCSCERHYPKNRPFTIKFCQSAGNIVGFPQNVALCVPWTWASHLKPSQQISCAEKQLAENVTEDKKMV